MKFTNNKILITGGTSGIGRELAIELRRKGNEAIVLGSNPEKLNAMKKEGFETFQCNLKNLDEIEAVAMEIILKHPDLNVLFNNAGVQFNYQFDGSVLPPGRISDEIAINLTGQILLTHFLLPTLSIQDQSYIINTTSGLGIYPKRDGLVYSASKAAMRNFTIGLRDSQRGSSVNVLELIPPVTKTPMTEHREGKMLSPETLVEQMLRQLENGKEILTIKKLRLFKWIALFLPGIAQNIVSK